MTLTSRFILGCKTLTISTHHRFLTLYETTDRLHGHGANRYRAGQLEGKAVDKLDCREILFVITFLRLTLPCSSVSYRSWVIPFTLRLGARMNSVVNDVYEVSDNMCLTSEQIFLRSVTDALMSEHQLRLAIAIE